MALERTSLHQRIETDLREAIRSGRLARRPRAALHARDGGRPRRLARRRGRGLRAAPRRGLAGGAPGRRRTASRDVSLDAPPPEQPAPRRRRGRDTTCARAARTRCCSRAPAGPRRCAPCSGTLSPPPSTTPTCSAPPALRRGARRVPGAGARRARGAPRRAWCARESATRSRWPAGALRAGGARRVVVEDPSHAGTRAVVAEAGLEPVPAPVDERGLVVDGLPEADAVLVTPAHQFPTGVVLPPDRRAALVAWARRHDARDPRGRLRRRVPLRPPPVGAAAGARSGARRVLRLRLEDARPPCGSAGPSSRPRCVRRSRPPARRTDLGTRDARPAGSGPVHRARRATTATCAARGRSTAAAATRSWTRCAPPGAPRSAASAAGLHLVLGVERRGRRPRGGGGRRYRATRRWAST